MTRAVANFDKLEERLRLSGEITTLTGLHVGGGGEEFGASELPVLRDAEGFPFIPGSSFKGALRSTLEAMVRAVDRPDAHLWACDPLDDNGACGAQAKDSEEKFKATATHCAACRLLGSRVLASHVRFSDALALDRENAPRVELRDGVAIDRDLKKVGGPLKYDFEVVPPGTRFELEVFIENPEDWLMGLLIAGFDQIANGFTPLGGYSSRGLGRVDLTWKEMERVNARQLLAGKTAKLLDSVELEAAFDGWRSALARHAHEEAG